MLVYQFRHFPVQARFIYELAANSVVDHHNTESAAKKYQVIRPFIPPLCSSQRNPDIPTKALAGLEFPHPAPDDNQKGKESHGQRNDGYQEVA